MTPAPLGIGGAPSKLAAAGMMAPPGALPPTPGVTANALPPPGPAGMAPPPGAGRAPMPGAMPHAGRESRKRSDFRAVETKSTDADQARYAGNGNHARHSTGEGEGGTDRFSQRRSLRRRCPEVRLALHS